MEEQPTISVIYGRKSTAQFYEAARILYDNDILGVLNGEPGQAKKPSKKQSQHRMKLESELLGFLKGGQITNQIDETLSRIKESWEQKIEYAHNMPMNDIISMRFESYLTLNDLIADLVRLVKSKMNKDNETYLTGILYTSVNQIIQQYSNKIRKCMRKDFKELIRGKVLLYPVIEEYRLERTFIPKSMSDFRQIREIYDYRYYSENKSLIQSSIKPVTCPIDCSCKSIQSDVLCQNIESKILIIKQEKIRCSRECKCMNFPIKSDIQLFLDVEEYLQAVPVWGFPYYTKKNIFFCLIGGDDELEQKEHFMNVTIPKAMNQLKLEGHSMKQVMEFILNCQDKHLEFTRYDKMQAQQLLKAIQYDKDNKAFLIFSKGLGLISINPYNFKVGDLIGVYLAETFSADIWFERQDLFKQLTSKAYSDELFNMNFQRFPEEDWHPNKFVILDPIRYGNQLCRISHSCQPNLKTEVVVSDGVYYIVFVVIQNISYGEELTFNYSSVKTDNSSEDNEYCFCGFCEPGNKYITKCEWRKAVKNWEPTCLNLMINACESAHINEQENWLENWVELVREKFMQISDLNTRQVMLDNLVQTYSRMSYYQEKQSPAYRYAHPLRRASMKEVIDSKILQMCELFLGSNEKEGELHIIAKYLKTEAFHCLKVVDQYRFYIKQLMDVGNFSSASKEIQNILQYLAIQVKEENKKLAQMFVQRSLIKTIFVFNQFPVIEGDEFQKTFFRCHRNMFKDYDKIDKRIKFIYDQHFLVRAALDITLDSNLNAIKKLYKFNFIFRSIDRYIEHSFSDLEGFDWLIERHQKLLANKRYFYAYEVDADERDSDFNSQYICQYVEEKLQATVRSNELIIKEEVYKDELVPRMPGYLPGLQQSEESTLDEEQTQPEKPPEKKNQDDIFRIKKEVQSEQKQYQPSPKRQQIPIVKTEVVQTNEVELLPHQQNLHPIKIEVKDEVVNEQFSETAGVERYVHQEPMTGNISPQQEPELLSQKPHCQVKTEPTESDLQNKHLKIKGQISNWLGQNRAQYSKYLEYAHLARYQRNSQPKFPKREF